jgi:flavin-dependent dehydrogenase
MTMLQASIAVVGGGPAGATAAKVLGELGHDVVLLERNPSVQRKIGEGLTPSITQVFDLLGIRELIDLQGFLRPRGVQVRWGGEPTQFRDQGDIPGYLVDRRRFDKLLLDLAAGAGARVLMACRAAKPRSDRQGWVIPVQHAVYTHVRADYLVDAAGKYSSISPKPARDAQPTAALYAYHDGGSSQCSVIFSCHGGWVWQAPLPSGQSVSALFLDRQLVAGASSQARRELFASSLAACGLDASNACRIQSCDATPTHAEVVMQHRMVRVGEASYALDPMSSQGVQNAMMSAWRGAMCLHNVMENPEQQTLAMEFLSLNQQAAVRRHAETAQRYYTRGASFHCGGFWRARHGAPPPPPLSIEPHQRVRISPRLAAVETPSLQGGKLCLQSGVCHPSLMEPAVFLGDERVADVIANLVSGMPARDNFKRLVVRYGPAYANQAFGWLVDNGLIEAEERVAAACLHP